MAIKSADQITILDVSDAYNVVLTSEAYTFIGNTSGAPAGLSCTTEAVAYCGSNQCSTVNVDAKSIVCPTGITATVENSGTKSPKITFRITALITAACEATIPISVDDVTINKKFSFAVAKTGQTGQTGQTGATGAKGDAGSDAITLTITTSNGSIFKNNTGETVLTAHVFKGAVEQKIGDGGVVSGLGTVKWYTGTITSSSTPIATGATYKVLAKDVSNSEVYTCQLE